MKKIHHIGYLVKNIEKATSEFIKLGYETCGDVVYDDIRCIDILFLEKDGYKIELVKPIGEKSVVHSLIKKVGVGPYHICYEVDDIEKAGQELRENGYVSLDESNPAVAIDGRCVAFFYNRYLGMIELVEK